MEVVQKETPEKMKYDVTKLHSIKVGLASPETIRSWSHGEVTKPETINYRSQRPEKDGLFCEKIFGPTKDYECYCGKYKKSRYAGLVCEKCGVELTVKEVRRERMGHIQLATPVAHIWYVKGIPSRIAQVLDIGPKELEEVVYFVSHICLDPGTCEHLKKCDVIDERKGRDKFRVIVQDIKEKIAEKAAEKNKEELLRTAEPNEVIDVNRYKNFYIQAEDLIARVEKKYDEDCAVAQSRDAGGEVDETKVEDDNKEFYDVFFNFFTRELADAGRFDDLMLDLWDEFKTSANALATSPVTKENKDKLISILQAVMVADDADGALTRCSELMNRLANPKETFDFLTVANFVGDHTGAKFGIGAEAIQQLLKEVDIQKEFDDIQKELQKNVSEKSQKRAKLLKRLEVVDAFRQSNNKPEWMILEVLPVIPPDLRPMLALDGGRFATSDLNDLYRRVITRNTRLKKLLEIKAPAIILMNEKRMLQEAVDALIDNGRRGKEVKGASGRALKSLSHALKGKQGRFRQNLLGKRVDFSGRSVIAVGPSLKLDECGVPYEMAIQLFKPFIAHELIARGKATNEKSANDNYIEPQDPLVAEIVEELVKTHPILLNRAPTLHRLGIQAFKAKLISGRAIRLHPLVCTAFNADFDGDQMAIHVPLSEEAIAEAYQLMLGSKNILGPKDGKPIMTPSQDILLGNYYLTTEYTVDNFLTQAERYEQDGNAEKAREFKHYAQTEGKVYNDVDEVEAALANRDIHLHSRIAVRGKGLNNTTFTKEQNASYLVSAAGRFIFNKIFPNYFPFLVTTRPDNFEHTPDEFFIKPGHSLNEIKEIIAGMSINPPFKKKDLSVIINESFARCGKEDTATMLDKLKDQGYYYSTVSAVTVSLSDIPVYDGKRDLIAATMEKVDEINRLADEKGLLTDEERHKKVCEAWTALTNEKGAMSQGITQQLKSTLNNPIFVMADSGARGNASNFMQLSGMRGIMENPSGEQIEVPITSSFREGLTVSEYFISSHGARKGGADTALKTAESGYLTRRLVDVAHDVVVREDDCGTTEGTDVGDLLDDAYGASDKPIETFAERILGRYPLEDVYHPETGELICSKDEIIDEEKVKTILKAGLTHLKIRTILKCKTKDGVCCKCYGRNLATGLPVEVGEAVGVMAAQSIGEPGTQLTMKNFHTGGVAGGEDITQGLPRVQELFEARNPKGEAVISDIDGEVTDVTEDGKGVATVYMKSEKEEKTFVMPFNARLRVAKGDKVKIGQKLIEGAINPRQLLEYTGSVEAVQNYILREVLKVYGANGIGIADKHIEIMIHQMFRKLLVTRAGDTNLIPGTRISTAKFTEINQKTLLAGGEPAQARPTILGVTKASLETESFLSGASFQETTKVLTDAATKGKIDYLHGLKENVLVGKLIPAGTTIKPLRFKSAFADEAPSEEEVQEAH